MNFNFLAILLCFYVFLTLVSMGAMNTGFGLVALYWAYLLFESRKKNIVLQPVGAQSSVGITVYRYFTTVLVLACMVSTVAALFYPFRYAEHAPTMDFHAPLKLWYLIIPAVLIDIFRRVPDHSQARLFQLLTRTWWWSTILFAIVALIQFKTGWPKEQRIPTLPGYFHAILFLGHHLSVASVFLFSTFTALAISMGNFAHGVSIRSRDFPKLELAAGLAGLLILFLTYARTAWLVIPIGLLLLFFKFLSKSNRILSGLGLLISLAGLFQIPAIQARVENLMGVHERITLWKANWDFFTHRPFTGIGWLKTQEMSEFYFKTIDPENYRNYFWGHAHNNFIEMLGGAGILGLMAFIAFMIFTLVFAYRTSQELMAQSKRNESYFALGICVALVLLHINGLTNVNFWEGKVFQQQMLALGFVFMLRLMWIKR